MIKEMKSCFALLSELRLFLCQHNCDVISSKDITVSLKKVQDSSVTITTIFAVRLASSSTVSFFRLRSSADLDPGHRIKIACASEL